MLDIRFINTSNIMFDRGHPRVHLDRVYTTFFKRRFVKILRSVQLTYSVDFVPVYLRPRRFEKLNHIGSNGVIFEIRRSILRLHIVFLKKGAIPVFNLLHSPVRVLDFVNEVIESLSFD